MAFDPLPPTWIDNMSEDGTDITIPIASFPELTAAEADAATGDIRKVMWAILQKIYDSWLNTDAADRPTKMTISKTATIDTVTDIVTNTFTIRFYTEVSSQDVVAE